MNYTILRKAFNCILLIFPLFLFSCKKMLDEKPDKALAVPQSISDYQAILDNTTTMNGKSATWDEGAADNFYIPEAKYNSMIALSRNAYIWVPIVYDGPFNDWANLYDAVYIANLSLEGVEKLSRVPGNASNWDNVKGSALFFRAQSFLHALFIYSKTYDSATAVNDYGIALRLSADFNQPSTRSSVQEGYEQVINDLKAAIALLPVNSVTPYRPSKPAAYALLARTYLSMRDYVHAGLYADSCLQIKNDLMDFNTLNLSTLRPFTQLNREVLFQRIAVTYGIAAIAPTSVRVDTALYQSYAGNDLRKAAYYYPLSPGYIFKGTYNGNLSSLFTGIATDEVYLMRGECFARTGNTTAAMNDLNALLQTRWIAGTFQPLTANSPTEALTLILTERRKELPFRCLRWMDIKRLNKEGANISLERVVNGQSYTLPPGDKRFALPLPADVVGISGMPQNIY